MVAEAGTNSADQQASGGASPAASGAADEAIVEATGAAARARLRRGVSGWSFGAIGGVIISYQRAGK